MLNIAAVGRNSTRSTVLSLSYVEAQQWATVTWKGRSHLVLCLDFVWTGVMGRRRRRKLSLVTKQMDRADIEDMGAFEVNSWVKRESKRVEDNG